MKTLKEELQAVGNSLKALRRPYEAHFRELGDNFSPRRQRFDNNRDHKSESYINRRILNSKPRLAHRTMQNGMQSGMTSPARPWFRLIPAEGSLKNNAALKEHLFIAQREMRQTLQSSGMYNVLHSLWGDLGLYGTDCAIVERDPKLVFYGQALVPGEYWLGQNGRGFLDTLYREFKMPVQQIVAKFVYRNDPSNKPDWSVTTKKVKDLWDKGEYAELIEVKHVIMPRYDRDARSLLPKDKPVMSVYWETGDTTADKILGNLGYDTNPIIASRWDATGTDVWGVSPAMDILGDAKMLQVQERDKAEAIRRMNRPPMNAPMDMKNSAYSLMPEAVNFMADPTKGLIPAYQVTPPLAHLIEDINRTEYRIDDGMFANLFLMIANLNRGQMTAREVDERHEEKLIQLGPVLERQHREKLGPVIRMVYNELVNRGKIPALPPELADVPIEIDYISMLAQAQKAVATGGIERLYGFVGNVSAADQSVLDKTDNDAAVDEYADMLGVPSNILRPQAEVDERRAQRQQMAQQQEQLANAEQAVNINRGAADTAKVLSETDATGRPIDILRNLGLQ